MIGRLSGILIEKNPPHLLIDCNGIGYEVDVPMSTFYNLPNIGKFVVLLIQQVTRNDENFLFGFQNKEEKFVFRELIKINGIGTHIAITILSGMSIEELVQAITLKDTKRLIQIPGLGKKIVDRLLVELQGKAFGTKLDNNIGKMQLISHNSTTDILNALMALGYSKKEIFPIIGKLSLDNDISNNIKMALKLLTKN